MAVTRYVVLYNSKVYQLNNVTGCTITSPSVTDGTYRDQPPVVVGGAAARSLGALEQEIQIAGGVSPVVTNVSGTIYSAIGASSVAQDDTYAHVAPRDYIAKLALLVFTTSDGITTYDCFFRLSVVTGTFNAPPPGWTVTTSQ